MATDPLQAAKDKVAQAAGSAPSEYFVVDRKTVPGTPSLDGNILNMGKPQVSNIQGTVDSLKAEVYNYAATRNPQFNAISNALYQSGFISKKQLNNPLYTADGIDRAVTVYRGYANANGSQAVSFKDWLAWYSAQAKAAGGPAGSGGGGGYSGPVTTTSYSLTGREDAEMLLNRAARDMIGRDLTKQELDKYVSQFNRAERENPTVTTSSGSGASRSSITKGGIDKQAILDDIISKNPDFANYQVDTGLMDFMSKQINEGLQVLNG